jgi:hypothetical protein
MTSPSSLDLYCISSLNHNALTNNDSTEHSLNFDDQELGSSKPLSGAYFSPLRLDNSGHSIGSKYLLERFH